MSLDAMHLLYTIEFVTWGQCGRYATTGHRKYCSKVKKLRWN